MILSKSVLKQIKEKIEKLVKKGESEERALALICDKNNLPVDEVKDQLDISHLYIDKSYKDIKYGEGSYVTLKKNTEKPYEVININNKDTIILRDLDDNSEIKVSEDEIIPMVTETKMSTNLNEAQYTVSIDNLETTDAETLSQMLSLAGQADSGMATDLPVEEPVAEPIPGTDLPPMEEPVDTFEPEIPATMDGPGFEAAEIDNFDTPMGDETVVSAEEELPPEEDVAIDAEAIDEPEMDECGPVVTEDAPIGEGVEEEVEESAEEIEEGCCGKEEEYDPDTKKEILKEEDPETIEECGATEPVEETAEEIDETELFTEADEELTEEAIEKEIAEALRIAGVQLNEVSDEVALDGKVDLPTVAVEPNADPTDKEQNGFEPGENQRPDWHEHTIEDITGAEGAQQGRTDMRPAPGSIYVGEMVSKDRINAICETAARMYAKKDKSEWLALDRRYVEKLIKEGVGYSNASKMILKAKAGK